MRSRVMVWLKRIKNLGLCLSSLDLRKSKLIINDYDRWAESRVLEMED